MAAAQREVWTGAQLRRLRADLELSPASVSALSAASPAQVKLTTLAAVCTALQCGPGDLFDVDTTLVERSSGPVPAAQPITRINRRPPGALVASDLTGSSGDVW
jgi:putative transcriptional regulator